MRVAFRVDASIQIGSGHVIRCLTLADALQLDGAECYFVCRAHDGNLIQAIRARGYEVSELELSSVDDETETISKKTSEYAHWLGDAWQADAAETQRILGKQGVVDWLVVDHYAIDMHWEQALRPWCLNLMVVDDLANRVHHCDLLLDQNLGRSAADYESLVPQGTKLFIGPEFALLRPEFSQLRSESLARRLQPELTHILISIGGVDKDNMTGQILDELVKAELPQETKITVVMGAHAPWLNLVVRQASKLPYLAEVLVDVRDMAQLMMCSDLAIGAAGGTAWERCCMGLPSCIFVLADNQNFGANALHSAHAAHLMRSVNDVAPFFHNLFKDDAKFELKKMSRAAALIADGQGVAKLRNYLTGHKHA